MPPLWARASAALLKQREEKLLVGAALREPLRTASEAKPEGARAESVLRAQSASRLQGFRWCSLQAERMHEELERAKNLGRKSG